MRDGDASDMPYSNTIERAISVTFSRSFDGAVRDAAEDDLLGGAAGERDLHQSSSSSFVWR